MRLPRWPVIAVSLLPFPVLAIFGHRAAHEHVRYYTGTEPRELRCDTCHVTGTGGGLLDRMAPPRYRSPRHLAVSPDGRRLYATAQDDDALLVADTSSRRLRTRIPVGRRPGGLALAPTGRVAYVANEGSDSLSVVDLERETVTATFASGPGPRGIVLDANGRTLLTANVESNDLGLIDAGTGRQTGRLLAGTRPQQVALAPDGFSALVSSELPYPVASDQSPVSEVTAVDLRTGRVLRRYRLDDAVALEDVAIAPQGDLALVPLIQPRNLLPLLQVARGWTLSNALGVIDLRTGHTTAVVLDDRDRGYADPTGVAITPDGRQAFVSHAGADRVTAIDLDALRGVVDDIGAGRASARDLGLARQFVRARIATQSSPQGLALSPDGRRLYVAEKLADSVAVIDTGTLEVSGRIDLEGPTRTSARRRGERLFGSASATFQGQFSCRSCHPEGGIDGLQWDFEIDGLGRNLVDNRSLIGLEGTAPFKWNGKNTSLFMQCGMRFARVLTRVEPLPPDDLAALVAYIRSLKPRANPFAAADGRLTVAQERGRQIYERDHTKTGQSLRPSDRCVVCHPPALYTNLQHADVGTGAPTDSSATFDTPHLTRVYATAPYLHDGRARTLEEIWTRFNPHDRHGVTSDLNKRDLNDLVEYLRTL